MLQQVTPEEISRNARYGLTKYAPEDADRINDTITALTKLANKTDALRDEIGTWLQYNVEYFNTLMARYTDDEQTLISLWMHNPCGSTQTKTGGNETWPLSVWTKWITGHRKYQTALRLAWEAAKVERLNQADVVNWWVY